MTAGRTIYRICIHTSRCSDLLGCAKAENCRPIKPSIWHCLNLQKRPYTYEECLQEIGLSIKDIIIHNDNQSAQKLVVSRAFHSRTKHIDVRHHSVHDAYEQGKITPRYMPTDIMTADVLTKGLTADKTRSCSKVLGLTIDGERRSASHTPLRGGVGATKMYRLGPD